MLAPIRSHDSTAAMTNFPTDEKWTRSLSAGELEKEGLQQDAGDGQLQHPAHEDVGLVMLCTPVG
jgi:hypothetical protein